MIVVVMKVASYCKWGRFTGLNFSVCCSFQEHRESFPISIILFIYIIQALYNGIFKCCKHKAQLKFSSENYIGWNLQKFSSANLSLLRYIYAAS